MNMLATGRFTDVFYPRTNQAMNTLIHEQLLPDAYGNPYGSKRNTPEIESKTGVTHRKRVPVACERCRKRKIKCSGDSGDGTGCDSCKSARSDGCQFLRVSSKLLNCHPTVSNSRTWHQHHYHPYSRSRGTQHIPLPASYLAHNTLTYSTWPNSIDYSSMPCTTTVPWNQSNYASSYPLYETENASSYDAQPPSYILPNPECSKRSNMNYIYGMTQPHQNTVWLDHAGGDHSMQPNTQISPAYPLTPADSTKSYSLMGSQAGQYSSSDERSGTSMTYGALPSMFTHGRDTPPLSAVSHHSSHTWTTDATSRISSGSTRTSCDGSQGLSTGQGMSGCEDQAAVYPYSSEHNGAHVTIPASALPIATDTNEQEQARHPSQRLSITGMPSSEDGPLDLRAHSSRESLRNASPVGTIYGYHSGIDRLSRRTHSVYPTKLLTSGFSSTWNPSPISAVNDRLDSQQHNGLGNYVHHGDTSNIRGTINYQLNS